jgi:hypothetical protein
MATHPVAARGLVACLLGLLVAFLLTAAAQGMRVPGSEPMLLGPFRWEEVVELA